MSPRFHVMFFTPRRSASAFARFSTSGDRSMPTTRLAQCADSTDKYPSPQAMSATSTGGSSRPSARDHAAQLRPGTNCAAVGAVDVEVLLSEADHFLQPRLVAAHRRRVRRLGKLRLQRGPQARQTRRRAGQGRGDRTKSRRRALRRRARLPSSRRRWRDTPDCAMPSTAVSSVTFSRPCFPASTRSSRRRTSSPSSRYSSPACFTYMNIYLCI